jgi:hypothetical protein
MYPNSGSGTFFSKNNVTTILDPKAVDLGALGHRGTKLKATTNFGLADYDKDGNLDAVITGPFAASFPPHGPAVFFAKGDGKRLYPTSIIENDDGTGTGTEMEYQILGSFYFSDVNSDQVMFQSKPENSTFYTQGAYRYDPLCPNSIALDLNCGAASYQYNGLFPDGKPVTIPIVEVTTPVGVFLFTEHFIFSDNAQQREIWNYRSKKGFTPIYAIIQNAVLHTDIGRFESNNEYATVYTVSNISPIRNDQLVVVLKSVLNIPQETVNNGNIGFYTENLDLNYAGGYPLSCIAMDFTNDGLDDLLVAVLREDQLSIEVHQNKGGYTFEKARTIQHFKAQNTTSAQLIRYDFNNDSKMDLYVRGQNVILIQP